jgi:hypothetical protein
MLRLKHLKLSTDSTTTTSGSKKVIIDTLKWPHLLWHQSESEWIEIMQEMPNVDKVRVMHFVVTGFYVSSEREPYVTVERSRLLSQVVETVLVPKGYKLIEAFELSAAFTFDTAGQHDGLHIVGPPAKAIVTKVFHHLCANVTTGTVV